MKVVPIDHGSTFPSRAGLSARAMKMGLTHNVLRYMDARHEPFDEDMQERIDLIDTDELGRESGEDDLRWFVSDQDARGRSRGNYG